MFFLSPCSRVTTILLLPFPNSYYKIEDNIVEFLFLSGGLSQSAVALKSLLVECVRGLLHRNDTSATFGHVAELKERVN